MNQNVHQLNAEKTAVKVLVIVLATKMQGLKLFPKFS